MLYFYDSDSWLRNCLISIFSSETGFPAVKRSFTRFNFHIPSLFTFLLRMPLTKQHLNGGICRFWTRFIFFVKNKCYSKPCNTLSSFPQRLLFVLPEVFILFFFKNGFAASVCFTRNLFLVVDCSSRNRYLRLKKYESCFCSLSKGITEILLP